MSKEKTKVQHRGYRYLWILVGSLFITLLLEGMLLLARSGAAPKQLVGGKSVLSEECEVTYQGYERDGAHLQPMGEDPQIWVTGLEGVLQSVSIEVKTPVGTDFFGNLYYPDETGALSENRRERLVYYPEMGRAVARLPRGEYTFLRLDIDSECDLTDIKVGDNELVSAFEPWELSWTWIVFLFVGSFLFGICWVRWDASRVGEKVTPRWSWALVLYGFLLVAMAAVFLDINMPTGIEIDRFLLLVGVAVVAVSLLFAFVVYCRKWAKESLFAALAFCIGLFYLLTITPMAIPDGHYHYFTSYQMSGTLLGNRVDGVYYGEAEDFDFTSFPPHYNTADGYRRVINELGGMDENKELVPVPYDRYDEYFVQELPSGLGITLARALGFNFVTTLMMGRLFNLLFFTACVYFAVKRAPRYKTLLGLAALVPMSLHQAASCSYDAFINGVSLFLIGSILKAMYEEGALSCRDFFCILVAGMLLAPAKVIYSAILLLCFLIPWERFGSKRKKLMGLGLIFLCAALFILIFNLGSLGGMVDSGDKLNWEGGHNYTLGFLFAHPLRTMRIFIRTLVERGDEYFNRMIGSSLCGLSLPISPWVISGFELVLALAAFNQRKTLSTPHRMSFLAVAAIVLGLAMLSMFLGWTSDTRTIIEGVQGRYLLPVLPLMVFALSDTLMLKRDMDRELVVTFVLLHGNVIANILSYTTAH